MTASDTLCANCHMLYRITIGISRFENSQKITPVKDLKLFEYQFRASLEKINYTNDAVNSGTPVTNR